MNSNDLALTCCPVSSPWARILVTGSPLSFLFLFCAAVQFFPRAWGLTPSCQASGALLAVFEDLPRWNACLSLLLSLPSPHPCSPDSTLLRFPTGSVPSYPGSCQGHWLVTLYPSQSQVCLSEPHSSAPRSVLCAPILLQQARQDRRPNHLIPTKVTDNAEKSAKASQCTPGMTSASFSDDRARVGSPDSVCSADDG